MSPPSRANTIFVLGSFVADIAMKTSRLPRWGETVLGGGAVVGPGGKGSNQAVAAARAGGVVQLLTSVGADAFGQFGRDIWEEAGVDASRVRTSGEPTGVAMILLEEHSGQNAIVISPGACATLQAEDLEACASDLQAARVLLAQLELPVPLVRAGLQLARGGGARTILNPAPVPASGLEPEVLAMCDIIVPNEHEAALLTGFAVEDEAGAVKAAELLQEQGARDVIVTWGAKGAVVCERKQRAVFLPAVDAGLCVDTTGAGDAFCGVLAAGLAEEMSLVEAARFACAGAGLAVTRPGTARAMPSRGEIQLLLA